MIHSGVTVIPEAFGWMLRALETDGVDGLIPAAIIPGEALRIVPPLGGSPTFSLFEGVTFTGALLVRSETLFHARAHRAFAKEAPFLGLADYCVTRASAILPFPLPVLERPEHYRLDLRSPLPARVAAYDESTPTERYYMLAMGFGAANGERPTAQKREVALAMLGAGLGPVVRLGSWGLRRARGVRSRVLRWMR
jgi:hypothetical protein